MKTIETMVRVEADRKLTVQLPPDVPLGEHRVVIQIDEQVMSESKRPPFQSSAYPVGLISDAFTFRREDLYDDPGA